MSIKVGIHMHKHLEQNLLQRALFAHDIQTERLKF